MKYLIGIALLMGIISCSNNDDNPVVVDNASINGAWRPFKYEFRGKSIVLNDCEDKGTLLINADFSGAYDRYETAASGNCNLSDSFVGKWNYDNLYNVLTLTYTEDGATKTMKKEVQSYSNTELRIHDSSKNLDNVPGNDDAILVFRKE
ncbi:lipocalin family protein [Chryseobacterium sp. Tr-659]|uniref:lipocalin family protein n=1 Tax=Chryseobacterium sp. Tr-659 TaxID=2608340 RepID=UPI00141FA342|nr:lipocalin family protein [Chryseobacterium sp. Tr-659]NIF03997.1 lipocalin family protein [Chryseobacterium sp. Tr-659]